MLHHVLLDLVSFLRLKIVSCWFEQVEMHILHALYCWVPASALSISP